MSETIQLACLPEAVSFTYPFDGIESYSIGWGKTSEQGKESNVLNIGTFEIYNGSIYCNYTQTAIKNWSRFICSGVYEGGKGNCQGIVVPKISYS